jgi:hypothetical protein
MITKKNILTVAYFAYSSGNFIYNGNIFLIPYWTNYETSEAQNLTSLFYLTSNFYFLRELETVGVMGGKLNDNTYFVNLLSNIHNFNFFFLKKITPNACIDP